MAVVGDYYLAADRDRPFISPAKQAWSNPISELFGYLLSKNSVHKKILMAQKANQFFDDKWAIDALMWQHVLFLIVGQ